jgi:hypothetical protein
MFWKGRYRKKGRVALFMRPRNSTAASVISVAELVWLTLRSGLLTPWLGQPDLNQS